MPRKSPPVESRFTWGLIVVWGSAETPEESHRRGSSSLLGTASCAAPVELSRSSGKERERERERKDSRGVREARSGTVSTKNRREVGGTERKSVHTPAYEMAFMMPVVKNEWDIYKTNRSRRSSECSNPQACRSRKVSPPPFERRAMFIIMRRGAVFFNCFRVASVCAEKIKRNRSRKGEREMSVLGSCIMRNEFRENL